MSDDPTPDDFPSVRPVENAGGRWGRVASRLGLTVFAGSGLLGRRRRTLLGERDGYLVAVAPTHSLNQSSVDILLRYPQGHTVRGLEVDIRRGVRRRRRRHVIVGDGTVMQRMPWALVPPSAGAIASATDELLAATRDRVRPLDRLCEACGGANDLGLFLSDAVPLVYCEACMAGYRRGPVGPDEPDDARGPDFATGVRTGLVAAVAFGLALGALASLAVVYAGARATLAAAPVFVALGFATSAFASRGFAGASAASTLAKLPLALAGVPIATTTMTAVGRMTLEPAEWNVTFLVSSLVGPFRTAPKGVALLVAAAAVGWLLEVAAGLRSRRTPRRRGVRIERVER